MKISIGLCGRYKLKKTRMSDGRVIETPWINNIITDAGLNGIGTKSMVGRCYVGSGSAAPSASDTALDSFIAASSSSNGQTRSAATSSPYYLSNVYVYRFDAGVAAGNITEVGIAPSGTVPQQLFSRALVLDGDGSPTTITVLPDEILDVTYECRAYISETDWTDTVTIDGNDYEVTVRAALATTAASPNQGPGTKVTTNHSAFARSGAIGAITGSPSGTNISSVFVIQDNYSNNSMAQQFHWTFPVDDAGNVQSMLWGTTYGSYQIGFSPAVPKLSSQTFFNKVNLAWARRSL